MVLVRKKWGEDIRLKSLDCLKFTYQDKTYIGGNQNWYDDYTKRLGSCGTITAINMLIYLSKTRQAYQKLFDQSIAYHHYREMMDRIYTHATPSELYQAKSKKSIKKFFGIAIPPTLGIRNPNSIIKGMNQYAGEMGIKLKAIKFKRWTSYGSFVSFIKKGLESDSPLALRNMFSGTKMQFDSPISKEARSVDFRLHWVTVIGIIEKERTVIEVLTWGGLARIDLENLWLVNKRNFLFPLRAFYMI